jgi:predicted ATPase with chaperone activity
MVASIAGEIKGGALTNRRPFRAPHHSASMPALVGGGLHARPGVRSNAAVSSAVLEDVARPDASGMTLLRDAADAMRLSARGYHRVLRVARTLADLDGAEKVGRVHLAEALSYRALADEVRRAA